jgi:uncharacterized protein (TIGR02680 family)
MQRTFDDFARWSEHGASEEALNHRVETFVEMLQAQVGGSAGYRLRRIILTNFWLYGLQEFEIPHGRLFLAGENASGKSTVLTAALPLALDGDLRPNRLDTFGGRERHMEYYVLGATDSATPFSHERRTAYIALEFEWCDPVAPPIAPELRQRWENGDREKTHYLTIGISLAGNVNASDHIRPLRFLITDGSRLGYDLHTIYETGNKHDKRAYDHARFKQQLEGHGIICDSQADYERQVARYLFGFSDEKDFQKLIDLLLVLRRPNLSTELSFSRVHDYLKQSLRKISGETTSRVIGTIERIDAIQGEIERIQEAYEAADRVHQTRQHLAQVRARLTACEYSGAQLAADAVQNRVTKLRKDFSTAENERRKAEVRIQALQSEQYQVNGQIRALEASEGLQVAQQLTAARERVREAEAQMHLQLQSLEAARQSLRENSVSLDRQRTRFEKMKTESVLHLCELSPLASDEALWDVAAFQLQEASRQIGTISAEGPARPELPFGVTSLLEGESEERIAWLRHIAELQQKREQLESRVQHARTLETMRFQELDETHRRFQSSQDRANELQQSLNKTLEQFLTADETTITLTDTLLDEGIPPQIDTGDDESISGKVVDQFAAAIKGYRRVIEKIEGELIEAADQAQGELNELQLLAGSKSHEVAEVRSLYEQKLSEPEFTPLRPTHRTIARTKLAEGGIVALPLYTLLDFTPGIDSTSEEAGRIEYMLEDAGLLDALVVAPPQVGAADDLLAQEGLSDCRLNIDEIGRLLGQHDGEEHLYQWLRFDTAALDSTQYPGWESVAATILTAIRPRSAGHTITVGDTSLVMNEDGSWTHGLLAGHAGSGTARCIGKATRLRIRQRELDELNAKRAILEEELHWLHAQLARYEQQLTQLQEKQTQLHKVLSLSGIEEVYAELAQIRLALGDIRSKYQRARLQTQEARQSCNTVIAQLERESKGIGALVSDAKRVQSVLMGTVELKNQVKSVQMQLASLINTWEEHQQARETLEKAKTNESNVTHLYERIHQQALQVQAEVTELLRIAASTAAEELSERLRMLREQSEDLSTKLDEAKTGYVRADERANNAESQLVDVEVHLRMVQNECSEKQERFVNLLLAYPVVELLALQQVAAEGKHIRAAQALLGEALHESDISERKERLEEEYRDVYNALSRAFNREQPLLLEYGPDLDDQGNVVFLNESKSRPVELLEILSDRIEMQKTLLGQEERQLFEDFLLQEIAEAIRTSIFEAEEWVQQINTVLSSLPMIGEHYSLQWKPPVEYDLTKLGSHLAQHYRLLRKPAQTLTAEETETLMSAFRQEIEAVRLRQQENPALNFMEALEQVFDYREWFHFDVWVTPIGGQRQRLTDRVAGTRSGAEQLFALYVPLFAALGALYRNAASGAPRLLALDEAFDKVSTANTQRIMEFLVSQDFQWIMTGPQISGTGAKIPACARYLMIHEKGSPIATASASFWSDNKSHPEK